MNQRQSIGGVPGRFSGGRGVVRSFLFEMAITFTNFAHVSSELWDEAIKLICYLLIVGSSGQRSQSGVVG
jgi:hypothetical protein